MGALWKHGVSSSALYENKTPRTENDSLAGPIVGAGWKFSTSPSATELLPVTYVFLSLMKVGMKVTSATKRKTEAKEEMKTPITR